MPLSTYITTGKLAEELRVPVWLVRRAVDALGDEIPRAGLYRLIPRELVPRIAAIVRRVPLPTQQEAARAGS
jgi:hypothetical protein